MNRYTSKCAELNEWMRIVVMSLFLFAIVTYQFVLPLSSVEQVCCKTVVKDLHLLTLLAEAKIRYKLRGRFYIISDGQSNGFRRYLRIHASYPEDNEVGYGLLLLAFVKEETTLGTDELDNYITFTLDLYWREWKILTALGADNCSVNKALMTRFDGGFVGCCSHRFNLGLQNLTRTHENIVSKIN